MSNFLPILECNLTYKNGLDMVRNKVKDVLKAFSQENDDKIDMAEIGNVFRCLKINMTQDDISQIEMQVGTSHDFSTLF